MKIQTKIILIIVFLFIFLFLIYTEYLKIPVDNIRGILNGDDFIMGKEESDKDDVVYFASGISANNFLKAVSKKTTYIKKSDELYKEINYNFDRHYTYEELEELFMTLNKSESVKIEVIGTSEDDRNVYSIEIGFGEKITLMDAGVHASEIGNPLFLTKFMIDVVNSYELGDQKIIDLLNKNKIIIVPVVNPDGYEMRLFGVEHIRKQNSFVVKNKEDIDWFYYKGNINGVDINRNMPSEHGGLYYKNNKKTSTLSLIPTGKSLEYYPGESMGSEKESINIIYWLYKYYKVSNAYISLHSSGRSIYNGKPNLSDEFNNISKKYAEVFNKYTDYDIYDKSDEEVGFGNDGTTTDFYSELVTGFKFSNKTGRLVSNSYSSRKTYLDYKAGTITLETLRKYTDDLKTIKNEWYEYKLYEILLDMINL